VKGDRQIVILPAALKLPRAKITGNVSYRKMFKIAAYFTCYANIFPVSYDDSLIIDLGQATYTFYFTALRILRHNASACFKENKCSIFV
tara:strand:+ start:84 stop:350 length:267 start_codon:yes stop_codon:yes gene_type:complete